MVEMVHHGCKFCYYQTQQLRCVRLVDAEGSSLKMTGRVIIYRFRFLVVKKLYVLVCIPVVQTLACVIIVFSAGFRVGTQSFFQSSALFLIWASLSDNAHCGRLNREKSPYYKERGTLNGKVRMSNHTLCALAVITFLKR